MKIQLCNKLTQKTNITVKCKGSSRCYGEKHCYWKDTIELNATHDREEKWGRNTECVNQNTE